MVPKGGPETVKVVIATNPYPILEARVKIAFLEVRRNPRKTLFLGKSIKTVIFTLFSTFLSLGGFAFLDRVLVGVLAKVSRM